MLVKKQRGCATVKRNKSCFKIQNGRWVTFPVTTGEKSFLMLGKKKEKKNLFHASLFPSPTCLPPLFTDTIPEERLY